MPAWQKPTSTRALLVFVWREASLLTLLSDLIFFFFFFTPPLNNRPAVRLPYETSKSKVWEHSYLPPGS